MDKSPLVRAAYRRRLSDDEARSLTRDPFQLYTHRPPMPWWAFWHPRSGFVGGCIGGLVAVAVVVFIAWLAA